MKDPRPQPTYRNDYRPPDYWIDRVELTFELDDRETLVTSKLRVRCNGDGAAPLVLHGEQLELLSIDLDGAALEPNAYAVGPQTLTVFEVPQSFSLSTQVRIDPHSNTALSGLYRSSSTLCTQCEAEGFRRITYFLDRPDVMARYETTIIGDPLRYPVMLSNGNRVASGTGDDGRAWVRWEDPFPKPSYLFALVAGDLRCKSGTFRTRSGRDVQLEIWVEESNLDSCDHALRSLQKAMKWDEEVYGLEYDLDIYMIVAVHDFNMGAMENKGLNVFNAKYVLARPETATDGDYEAIEGVIAHEYFHNWTGNRVTCRDWFQLTLKEGLTVFRDEQFTADMTSAAVKRIEDVKTLRTAQFAEDQSPSAHPIRPDSYIEMNNFYTVTVYNKGAEVVRMIHTLLGSEAFRKGMDLYFERHDGQAVTCDDFRGAMADASGVDLEQFGLWYSQAGTPIVEVEEAYDEANRTLTLSVCQRPAVNAPEGSSQPMHIPLAVGLVDPRGTDITPAIAGVQVRGNTALLELREADCTFVFRDVPTRPIVSVPRGFSAPIRLAFERSIEDLAALMAHDSDAFCRWDAAQVLATTLLLATAREGDTRPLDPRFVAAFGRILDDSGLDGSLKALTLTLPQERLMAQQQEVVDVDGLHRAREDAAAELASAHRDGLLQTYHSLHSEGPYRLEQADIAARRLKNVALAYLCRLQDPEAIDLATRQFARGNNMTDVEAALSCLVNLAVAQRDEALRTFFERWKHDPLVIDKWFAVQALSSRPDALERVIGLAQHPAFNLKNPNRVRALLGTFSARNQVRFHGADGRGYAFLATKILELDAINPQVAARIVQAFSQWRRFDPVRQDKMRTQLERIVRHTGLSRDVYELAGKALGKEP